MLDNFKDILNHISEQSTEDDSKEELIRMIKDLEKQVARLEFKYQKTLQEKQSLSNLLEQSINELEEKKASVEQSNKVLRDTNMKLIIAEEEIRQNAEELKTVNETLEEKIIERTAELIEKNAIIQDKSEKIFQSITYAQNIQKAFFPELSEVKSGFKDAFIFFQPLDIVSGDFYWYHQAGNKVILAAMDCTGHGVPGAFMSIIANEFLNQIIIENQITEPDKVLNLLHLKIRKALKQSDGHNRDGLDAAMICYDREASLIEFAGAKNPVLIVQNGEMQLIKGDKMPVGGEQKEAERKFTKNLIPIQNPEKETMVYLYSDGYQDQFGGYENKKFMSVQFREFLHSIHPLSCGEQEKILSQTLEKWMGNLSQIDDILVIGVKIQKS